MDFLKEIIFGTKKSPAVAVIGEGRFSAVKIMKKIMSGLDIKIFESDLAGKNKLEEDLSKGCFLVFNYDDELAKELKNKISANVLSSKIFSFGFGEGADFRASDINVDDKGINFKIINEDKTIHCYLDVLFGKQQIYSALAAL